MGAKPLQGWELLGKGRLTASTISAAGTTVPVATPCRLRGVYFRGTAVAGTVVLKNDSAGTPTAVFTLPTPAVVGWGYVPVPGDGALFLIDMQAVLTNVDGAVLYTEDL